MSIRGCGGGGGRRRGECRKIQGGSVRFRTISILNESLPFVSVRFGSVPLIFRFGSVRCRLFCGPVRFDLSGPNSIAYDYMNDGL